MKKTLSTLILLLATLGLQAQDRRWEHNLHVGSGLLIDNQDDPLNGRSKIKPFSLCLQPSITYQWRRMSLGVEATVGLLNDGLHHGLRPGHKRRLSNVMALLGVRF